MNLDTIKGMLERFCALAQSSDNPGQVTLEQFAKYLDLPVSQPLEELFALIDRVRGGWGLREDPRLYWEAVAVTSSPLKLQKHYTYAWKLKKKWGFLHFI